MIFTHAKAVRLLTLKFEYVTVVAYLNVFKAINLKISELTRDRKHRFRLNKPQKQYNLLVHCLSSWAVKLIPVP